jgi:plasmid stabilization system protein ParE
MAYIVELMVKLMPRARRDLRLVFDYIHAGAFAAAFRRYQGLEQENLSREQTPNRCPAAAENGNLRHLLYGGNPHV